MRAVLIIDGDSCFRDTVEVVIRSRGLQAFAIDNAVRAADLSKSEGVNPELVLIDVSFPERGLQESLALIRKSWSDVPIVGMSTRKLSDPPAGVQMLLRKPFGTSELWSVINRYFSDQAG